MDLKWLEDFVSLTNTGSFSRSALERNVTQPAFSRRIRALERWLGAELIDRSTYPTTLTVAGRTFRSVAEEALTLLDQQRSEFKLAQSRSHAAVRFTALHTISITFFPRWLRSIEDGIGGLTTRMVPGNFHDCVDALSEGDADFLLCFAHEAVPIMVDPTEFPSVVVARELFLPVARPTLAPSFPGAPEAPVRFLSYSSDCFLGRIVDHILDSNPEHNFAVCYENSMAEALKAMALEGYGAAWLPHSSIRRELETGELAQLGAADWQLTLEIRLYRSRARLRPAAAALWDRAVADARLGALPDGKRHPPSEPGLRWAQGKTPRPL